MIVPIVMTVADVEEPLGTAERGYQVTMDEFWRWKAAWIKTQKGR